VDLDWKKMNTIYGPPLWKRLTEEEVEGVMSDAGFTVAPAKGCGKEHYIIVGEKG
jgi:hypothetical protein